MASTWLYCSCDVASTCQHRPHDVESLDFLVIWNDVITDADLQEELGHQVRDEAQQQPSRGVLQGDKSLDVVRVLAVVPGTRIELSQQQAPHVLPDEGYEEVQRQAVNPPDLPADVQRDVEHLHHQTTSPVDQEGRQGRLTFQLPVSGHHEVVESREDDLMAEALDAVDVETQPQR